MLTKSMRCKEKITGDLKNAMKRGDTGVVSVLRMTLSAIRNREIEKRVENLGDEEVERVLATEARKCKEAAMGFKQGGRLELAQKEKQELAIIKAYLPEEASEEEIRQAVQDAIIKTGAINTKDVGKVMGIAMGILKGRADGGMVQGLAREILSG